MAASVNRVILIGNLGKDPETRTAQNGTRIVSFTLATSETWNDKGSGERKERTEWHRVVCFNEQLGNIIERYCQKGSKVYLEGSLATRKWTDNAGVEKHTTEVTLTMYNSRLVLLDGKQTSENQSNSKPAFSGKSSSDNWEPKQRATDLDDDIPF